MSEDQSPSEKPHEATAKRLEDARNRGEIPRSMDLNTAAAYAGLLLACGTVGVLVAQQIGGMLISLLGQADRLAEAFSGVQDGNFASQLIFRPLLATGLLLALPAGFILILITALRGWAIAPSKLAPKLSRISPLATAKQKFGRTGLFEFAKSTVKMVIFSIALFLYLYLRAEWIFLSITADGGQILTLIGRAMIEFMALVFVISAVIGVIDYLWQIADHLRQNRMTRQEVQDDSKEAEGDPAMKQQRRQRAYDIATNQMLLDVPKADVIVVNPTHYAVALKWDRSAGEVPVCVAKGIDEIAARIRETAAEHGVPIFSDPPTARALHATIELGEVIRPDHYRAVAAAIRFADAIREKARGKAT